MIQPTSNHIAVGCTLKNRPRQRKFVFEYRRSQDWIGLRNIKLHLTSYVQTRKLQKNRLKNKPIKKQTEKK